MSPTSGPNAAWTVHGDEVIPSFLREPDHPWLRALLDLFAGYEGRPLRDLHERLQEPLRAPAPHARVALVAGVLERLVRAPNDAAVPPRLARAAAFGAAVGAKTRIDALSVAATSLGVDALQLEAALFADLPGERRVGPLREELGPGELALRTNGVISRGLLARASTVDVALEGQARRVVRAAQSRGLICVVRPPASSATSTPGAGAPGHAARLEVSGPLALFRRTLVYGRALGDLLPSLAWCDRFALEARVALPELGERRLRLRTGDPLPPGAEGRRHDSKLEASLARDLARLAPAWEIIREPEPVSAGDALIYPDFALVHRHDPARRWLLEVVGFWTPAYLDAKLSRLRRANLDDLILCVDADRACADDALPAGARVLPFRRRIDASAILSLIDPS